MALLHKIHMYSRKEARLLHGVLRKYSQFQSLIAMIIGLVPFKVCKTVVVLVNYEVPSRKYVLFSRT